MALAVCIKCGEQKLGAFTECGDCGFEPARPKDKARSMFLSEHHFSVSDLDVSAARIRNKDKSIFNNIIINNYKKDIEVTTDQTMLDKALGLFLALCLGVPFILLFIGLEIIFVGVPLFLLVYIIKTIGAWLFG